MVFKILAYDVQVPAYGCPHTSAGYSTLNALTALGVTTVKAGAATIHQHSRFN